MCLFLGMNTRPDVVSVLVLLSYTNYCSQPMNLFELYFFPVKFHLLSPGSRPTHMTSTGLFTKSMGAVIFPKIICKRLLLKLKKCAIF